jgi:hypothetical protein
MRDDHVTDRAALGFVQGDADATRVDGNAIVNEEAGQALRRVSAPAGVKRAG